MSESNLNATITMSADNTDVEQKINATGRSLKSLGAAAQAAGKDAADGMAKVGGGGDVASAKIEKATKSIISSIERQTAIMAAGEKGTAKYYEALANTRGVNADALKPYLEQLGKVGEKTEHLNFATAGARRELIVLAHELSQGNFKNFGGSLLVLAERTDATKLLFSTTALAAAGAVGAIAAVAYAFSQADHATKEFQKSLILSGDAVGSTVTQLSDLSSKINNLGISSKGGAAEAINALVASGTVASSVIEGASIAAIKAQKLLGLSVEDTVKEFTDLGKTPAESIEKLNDKYHFLTSTIYEQIKALQDQGKSAEAATLAQSTYADALIGKAQKVNDTLSDWARGWNRIKEAISSAADASINVFSGGSNTDKIKGLLKERDNLASFRGSSLKSNDTVEVAKYDYLLDQNKKSINALRDKEDALKATAKAESSAAIATSARIKFINEGDKYLSKSAKTEKEVAEARNLGATAGLSASDIEKRVADIREKNADKAKDSISKEENAYKSFILAIKEKVAVSQAELISDKNLTEGAKLRIKFDTDLREGKIAATAVQKEYARALATQLDTNGQLAVFEKVQIERTKQIISNFTDQYEATKKITKGVEDYAAAIADANALANFELSIAAQTDSQRKIAIEQFKIELALKKEIKAIKDSNAFADAKPGLIQQATDAAQTSKDAVVVKINTDDIQRARKELDAFLDPTKAQTFGEALTGSLQLAGNALSKLSVNLQEYGRTEAEIAKQRANAELIKSTDPKKYAQDVAAINEKSSRAQINNYANLAGAAKGFFHEGTKGYKALEAAENAFRVVQLASDLARGISAAAVGIANQASGDPYSAFARMAVMAAAMAALGYATGFAGSSGSGGQSSADAQKAQGSGDVFGDTSAKSQTISKTIEAWASTSSKLLPVNQGMLAALRNIESAMAGFTGLITRTPGVTDGSNLGIQTGQVGLGGTTVSNIVARVGEQDWVKRHTFGTISRTIENLYSKTTQKIVDAGVQYGGSVSALSAGKGFSQYASVDTTKTNYFGLKKNTTNSVQTGSLSEELSSQFALIFTGVGNALKEAAKYLGSTSGRVTDILSNLKIDTTKISLKGLTGAALTEAINTAISKSLDQVAKAVFPELDAFRQVGEGYAQTVFRVANGVGEAGDALDKFGIKAIDFKDIINKQGDVGAEIFRQSITDAETKTTETITRTKGSLDSASTSVTTFKKELSGVGEIIQGMVGTTADLAAEYSALLDIRKLMRAANLDGQALSGNIIKGAGGQSALSSGLSTYADKFFSQDHKDEIAKRELNSSFAALGITAIPKTREEFVKLVSSFDLTTEAGQRLLGGVLNLSGTFDAVTTSSENYAAKLAASAKQIADAGHNLDLQYLDITDPSGAKSARRKDALDALTDPGLKAKQQKVFDAQDAKESADKISAANAAAAAAQETAAKAAQDAAQRVVAAWQSVTDSIVSEIQRIRGLIAGDSAASYAGLQAKFTTTTAQARAGDQEAAKLLPSISQALLAMAENQATSSQDLTRIRGLTAGSLETTVGTINTNFGTGLSQNGSNAELIAEIRQLRLTVDAQQKTLDAIRLHSGQTANLLDSSTAGGGAMLVQIA